MPIVQAPNTIALTEASNATTATQQATSPAQTKNNDSPSVIIVEFLGYGGGCGDAPGNNEEENRRKPQGQQTYDVNSPYQVLGVGTLTDDQVAGLAAEKRGLAARP